MSDITYNLADSSRARPRFAVAPMLDWTDRHCRFLFRQLSKHALLYTEMLVADAVIYGPRNVLLDFSDIEHPIAAQLGGSDPDKLAQAAKILADWGYDEINLNIGCPSDRVQSGAFGACLMQRPLHVAKLVESVKKVVNIPVTIKCRIGVDDQPIPEALYALVEASLAEGVDAFWVHARPAWLKGLSPKENRTIPPLNYRVVYELKERYPNIFIGLNGGIDSFADIASHLKLVDAVMLGRAVYSRPELLSFVDKVCYDSDVQPFNYPILIDTMINYAEEHIRMGGKLHHITRHMHGLFQGYDGAKNWRRILSTASQHPGDVELIAQAFAAVNY